MNQSMRDRFHIFVNREQMLVISSAGMKILAAGEGRGVHSRAAS